MAPKAKASKPRPKPKPRRRKIVMFLIKPNQIVHEVKGRPAAPHQYAITPGWVLAERFEGGEAIQMKRYNYDYIEPLTVILPPRWWVLRLNAKGEPMGRSGRIFVELEKKAKVEDTIIIPWPFGNVVGDGAICWGPNAPELATGMPIALDAAFMNSPFTSDYSVIPRKKNLHEAVIERMSEEQIKLRGLPTQRYSLQKALDLVAQASF